MRRSRFLLSICPVVIAFATLAPAALSQNYDADHLQSLKWRQLNYPESGPATAATGIAGDTKTYFVAAGPGGLWKTTDSGVTWTSIFDGQAVASVSSVAVSESEPNLLYVGTGNAGEETKASSSSPGNGVYKSADAGHTWTHLGLDETRYIGKIIVDPHDPNTVFVVSLGHIFGPNPDRGVFRSQDGGQTWEKVLYKDEATGAIDIAFDPQNSKTLFASLCQEIRTPGHFSTMGPGSGFYKSIDAGATWAQLRGPGLPEGVFGRIGVAVSGADSNRIYALIEADKDGGLYRSTDGGDSWQLVNSAVEQSSEGTPPIAGAANNAAGVYLIGDGVFYSANGGANFTSIHEAGQKIRNLWIDPGDPRRLIAATGSGPELSNDGGRSWSAASPLPTAQFNHVAVDTRFPYYVYGALSAGSVLALASDPEKETLGSPAKYEMRATSSSYLASDRTNPDLLYAGSYAGRLTRFDKRTDQAQDISLWPEHSHGGTI